MSDNFNLCIIAQQLPKSNGGEILVKKFIKLCDPLCSRIFVITSNYPDGTLDSRKISLINVPTDDRNESLAIRSIKYVLTQIKFSIKMVSASKEVDAFIFFVGGSALILPMISAKLMHKKVALETTGSGRDSVRAIHKEQLFGHGGTILSSIMKILEGMNYNMADRIVVSSNYMAQLFELNIYQEKIRVAQCNFYNLDEFRIFKNLTERTNLIGYVGRLSEEKGIINFIESIPIILKDNKDTKFLIIGSGKLEDRIKAFVKRNKLENKVSCIGWLPYEQLPDYLNDLKLLVVPSYTEAIPSVIFEAMACGVPVLSTPAGAIPDVLRDNETGFLMDDNSPECIASNVKRVMGTKGIEWIIRDARSLVEKRFTYSNVVEERKLIINELINKDKSAS